MQDGRLQVRDFGQTARVITNVQAAADAPIIARSALASDLYEAVPGAKDWAAQPVPRGVPSAVGIPTSPTKMLQRLQASSLCVVFPLVCRIFLPMAVPYRFLLLHQSSTGMSWDLF